MDNQIIEIGQQLYDKVDEILKDKSLTRTDIANSIGRSITSFNKLLYDLKVGKISLKNLIIITTALDVELSDFFKISTIIKEEKEMYRTLILQAVNPMTLGTKFELKEILSSVWSTLSYPDRQRLGKQFNQDVLSGLYPMIKFIGKKSNNHAEYEKQ